MFCSYCGAPNPDVASFCNKCGKAVARTPAGAPVHAQPIADVLETPPAESPSAPAPVVLASPARQETFGGTLTSAARTEFAAGLTAELRRQIDDRCFLGAFAAGIVTLIAIARFTIPEFGEKSGGVFAFALAFVLAGIVFKIAKAILKDKYVRTIR